MEKTDINRRLHLALGKTDWYETTKGVDPHDDWKFRPDGSMWGALDNPDYCNDPRLVLMGMMKREDWDEFAQHNLDIRDMSGCLVLYYAVSIDLIMNREGKLAKLALEWIEGRKGCNKTTLKELRQA